MRSVGGPLPEPPPMDDRDAIDAHDLHARRTLAAFLWGTEPGARTRHAESAQGLLIGAAIGVVIVLVIGVVALVQASRHRTAQVAAPMSAQATASTAAS
jgi:hypothetical protein